MIIHPVISLYGYLATYFISPHRYWWGSYVPSFAYRYSLILGTCVVVGSFAQRKKLERFGQLCTQEILLLMFVGVMWLSHLIGLDVGGYESNVVKMTKVSLVILMAGRLVTDLKKWDGFLWIFILTGFFLGINAFQAPPSIFIHGRLSRGIGGSDFAETNFLAAHFAFLLPFIGVKFLQGDWKIKALTVAAGAFVFNGIVLCRSRGVFLAMVVGGVVAFIFAKKEIRKKIFVVMILGAIGGALLVDPGFWQRATKIGTNERAMDASAAGRIEAWKAALAMVKDYPLGVGEGNFKILVGQYNPAIPGKDTHNTWFRCLAELGIQGFIILNLMVLNAFVSLSKTSKQVNSFDNEQKKKKFLLEIYALRVGLIIFLVAALFITETYIEEFYWFLMMPVFLQRAAMRGGLEQRGIGK